MKHSEASTIYYSVVAEQRKSPGITVQEACDRSGYSIWRYRKAKAKIKRMTKWYWD